MKYLKAELLIIIFLWANIIYSLINLQTPSIFLILGIVGLAICSILFRWNNRVCVLVLSLLLAVGSISLISFNDSFQMTFMEIINIQNLLLLIILIYKKREVLSELKDEFLGNTKEDVANRKKSEVAFFRKKFENLSTEILQNKLSEELTPEAKKAIREILISRNSNS